MVRGREHCVVPQTTSHPRSVPKFYLRRWSFRLWARASRAMFMKYRPQPLPWLHPSLAMPSLTRSIIFMWTQSFKSFSTRPFLCPTVSYIASVLRIILQIGNPHIQVLNKLGHSYEVDMWSIGCIMFTLLVGESFCSLSLLQKWKMIFNWIVWTVFSFKFFNITDYLNLTDLLTNSYYR